MPTSTAATAIAQSVYDGCDYLERAASTAKRTAATDEDLAVALDDARSGVESLSVARDALDALDVTADLAWTDPRETIRRWLWQRQSRAGIVSQLRSALDLAESIEHVLRRRFQRRKHTVVSGQTLQSIALATLGDWQRWTEIADANGLDYGATLTVGSELIIPER